MITLLRLPARMLLIAAFVAAPLFSQDTAGNPVPQIEEFLDRAFPADAPGAAVLVVHRGQVLLRKGYGAAHLELGVPMKPEHIFRIGSLTKQFTAVAILQLVEAGKLSLDDEITRYIPAVETDGHRVTLRQLLHHTAGIPSFTDQPAWRAEPRKDMTLADELAYIKGKPFHFAPDTDWRYSNTGYRLLGEVVEKVSGQSYADYMTEHIFRPAGMTSTSYDDTSRVIVNRIPGYTFTGAASFQHAAWVSMTQPHGAGALISNVDDLWQWDQALTAGTLIPPARLAEAFVGRQLKDGRSSGYGFGWTLGTVAGRPSAEHGGGIQGFATYALRVPDAGLFVAVLCNADNPRSPPSGVAVRIATLVLGKPSFPPVDMPAETLARYVGVFRQAPGQKFELLLEGSRLALKTSRGPAAPLTPLSPTEFIAVGSETRYRFLENRANRPDRVRVTPRIGAERSAVRVDEPLMEPEKPAVAVDAAVLDRYVGNYELSPGFTLSVRREGAGLVAQATGQRSTTLIAESTTRFRILEVTAVIEFKQTGTETSLTLFQNGAEIPGKRVK